MTGQSGDDMYFTAMLYKNGDCKTCKCAYQDIFCCPDFLALFNSPKRKTDFAANKKPTPSKLPTRTKVSIKILSI